jgi:hypothetical protein
MTSVICLYCSPIRNGTERAKDHLSSKRLPNVYISKLECESATAQFHRPNDRPLRGHDGLWLLEGWRERL